MAQLTLYVVLWKTNEVYNACTKLASLDKIQSPVFVPLAGVSARFKKNISAETELSQSVLPM